MQKFVFGMTSPRGGPGFDRKAFAPFQAIIEKGKQAKAQVELDQYEARKAKRETDIKNAARIRHVEAEANRRLAEESKLSIDDHKGKLLDAMTNNIKALLEDHYREEIRQKVYEDEDKIISAYKHDVKDQTTARLVRELESVVKAKLEAEFEPEAKQRLAVELLSVVKADLRMEYETEVKQQLVKELRPVVEAELRAKYMEEFKNQLVIGPAEPTIVQKLNGTHTSDVEHQSLRQHDALYTLDGESFRATSNDIDSNEGEYPDLSQHQYLINQNGVKNGQLEAVSVQNEGTMNTDRDGVNIPHGTKRSLGAEDEDPYPPHSKRSRSASCNSQEQQSLSGYHNGVNNLYPKYSIIQETCQSVDYVGEENQGFPKHNGHAGYEDTQGNNGFKMESGASDYNSSDEFQGSRGIILERRGADYNSAEDTQMVTGDFLDREGIDYDSAEDIQETNENLLRREEAGHESAEEFEGSSGYRLDGADTDSFDEDDDDDDDDDDEEEEDYESEEEEQYSTAPQAASYPNAGDGVITISNTQDTAFVLSDSEDDEDRADDEDKTLVNYEGPAPLSDAKQCDVPVEEPPSLNA